MAKKLPIFRTTISISGELKKRMDAAGEDVNWSAVASRAFEAELFEIAAKKGRPPMADVVQRLKASMEQAEERQYHEGKEVGRGWAESDAEADELIRLERIYNRSGTDWSRLFDTGQGVAYGASERVYFWIDPDNDGDRHAAASFWEGALGDDVKKAQDDSFVRGFCEGALELWDEVKGQL